jgi:hypothetical protein
MNTAAFFDGLLAATAFWLALRAGREYPAVRLGCLLLASAAVLGTLRFSGAGVNHELHRLFSFIGAGVGLPLVAITVIWPSSGVATTRRYAWVFGVIAAVICMVFDIVLESTLWSSAASIVAALTILWAGVARKQAIIIAAGLAIVAAFSVFALKPQILELRPGDWLHIGLALGLLLIGRWLLSGAARQAIRESEVKNAG